MADPILIAIDGPSGVGKSTVAKQVARDLAIPYLDTGKLYRAIGVALNDREINLDERASVKEALTGLSLELKGGRPHVNGVDLFERLLDEEAGALASRVSRHPEVRSFLVAFQQEWGRCHGGVLEGRDIGLRVFPDTPHKFFLHAEPSIRIWRRISQTGADPGATAEDVMERDRRDRTRSLDPLTLLPNHIPIDTGRLSAREVADLIVELVGMKMDVGNVID